MMLPFPLPDVDAVVGLSASSGASTNDTIGGTGNQILLMNSTSQACFVAVGDSTIEAAVGTCAVVHGNTTRVFTIPPTATHIAGITASGSTTLYYARGEGF